MILNAEYNEDCNKNEPKFKLVIVLKFQNKKTFLQKDTLKIGLKRILVLAKLTIQFLGLKLLVTGMVKQLLEVFI